MVLHRLGFAPLRRAPVDFGLELHAITALWRVREAGAGRHAAAIHAAANQFSGEIRNLRIHPTASRIASNHRINRSTQVVCQNTLVSGQTTSVESHLWQVVWQTTSVDWQTAGQISLNTSSL